MSSPLSRTLLLVSTAAVTICTGALADTSGGESATTADWEVDAGFALDVHATGFEYPTALAFVPDPGPGPDAPLYFVTELRGRVKVVTRSGSVHLFADDFTQVRDQTTTPGRRFVENGTAGICLAPAQGYVFVTFVYRDEDRTLRNGLIRFSAQPETFSLAAQERVDLSRLFRSDPSYESHQIGPCQVRGEQLYLGVGDAFKLDRSQRLNSTLGKILRMDLDAKPIASNPYYREQLRSRPVNFVWAYGLRNPFGLEVVDGRVFVAENGPNVDRFLEVLEGEKLLWNGRDWSIGTNAAMVFAPSVSPVQLAFHSADSGTFPPEYRDRFYLALSGGVSAVGPGAAGEKSIVTLDYDFERRKLRSPPKHFLRYRGKAAQALTALAFGAEGLYFAPLLPDAQGQSAVLRVRYAPQHAHRFVMGETNDPVLLMEQAACLSCHQLAGRGGSLGPGLDQPELSARLLQRLSSSEYLASLAELDQNPDLPYASQRDARREVADASGIERVRIWMRHRLLEPRFDSTASLMPPADLSAREAAIIVDHLLEGRGQAPAPEGAPEPTAETGAEALTPAEPARATNLAPLLAAFAAGILAATLAVQLARRFGSKQ